MKKVSFSMATATFGATLVASHSSAAQNTQSGDDSLWTLDWGNLAYVGEEVHAEPAGGDYRSSYFVAPSRCHGDWTGFQEIVFEK